MGEFQIALSRPGARVANLGERGLQLEANHEGNTGSCGGITQALAKRNGRHSTDAPRLTPMITDRRSDLCSSV